MTIAAGFLFDGGTVVCADSEEAIGQSVKVSVPKIEVFAGRYSRFVVTGAGDSDLLTRAFADLEVTLEQSTYPHDVLRAVEAVVRDLYANYVDPAPEDRKPLFEVLVGFHMKRGAGLVKMTGTAAVMPKTHAEIGYGGSHAALVMDRWFRPAMPEPEAILLACYMLQQTKKYAPYCGGQSRIYVLHRDGQVDSLTPESVQAHDRYADRFELATRGPFRACVNEEVSEDRFQQIMITAQGLFLSLRQDWADGRPRAYQKEADPSEVSYQRWREKQGRPKRTTR